MKNSKTSNDIFVLNFVQTVSSPQTHAKRANAVRKMFQSCPDNLTITQWMQLWRGIYYVIWYEEMRKGGEELIEEMANTRNSSFLMSGFKSMTKSWNSIDAFRVDKYMFLIRIMLRNILQKQIQAIINQEVLFKDEIFIKTYRQQIDSKVTKLLDKHKKSSSNSQLEQETHRSFQIKANVIDYILHCTSESVGLFLHICDIYLEELKRSLENFEDKFKNNVDNDKDLKAEIYHEMLRPFIKWIALIKDERLLKSIQKDLFESLLNETILDESFSTRKLLVQSIIDSFTNLDNSNNINYRRKIINDYEDKIGDLCGANNENIKTKRKVIGLDRRSKRIKYEMTSKTPFVRSIIPLPVV